MIVGHQAGSYDSETNFGGMRHGEKSIQAVSGDPPCRCLRSQTRHGGLEYIGLGHGRFRSPKTVVDQLANETESYHACGRKAMPALFVD
jgi:hypothetical protein